MEDFYRDQRRRFSVLIEPDGDPVGRRWNLTVIGMSQHADGDVAATKPSRRAAPTSTG
jgi:deoxyribodipyrimidine photolyase-like uncharacterized protein